MGFSEFLGNEAMVAALRGALRAERVPHAMLFTGPRGVGKFTLARMFAQAANCERLKDDFCGECPTCQRIGQLANLDDLIAQGLAERGRRPLGHEQLEGRHVHGHGVGVERDCAGFDRERVDAHRSQRVA